MIEVRLSPRAVKDLKKLDPQDRQRIAAKLQELREHPKPAALLNALQGYSTLYKIRIGHWRAIGPFDGERFLVRWIGKRDDVYKQLRR